MRQPLPPFMRDLAREGVRARLYALREEIDLLHRAVEALEDTGEHHDPILGTVPAALALRVASPVVATKKRRVSPEGRARIAAAMKRRWAVARKAGVNINAPKVK